MPDSGNMRGECIDTNLNPGLRVEPNFIDEKEEEELVVMKDFILVLLSFILRNTTWPSWPNYSPRFYVNFGC